MVSADTKTLTPASASVAAGVASMPHISVCVCTYKRPAMLLRLLNDLKKQKTEDAFTFSIVIADNDEAESARSTVEEFGESSSIAIKYCVEPRQNIALARNKVVGNAEGDFLAFIDDDEFPANDWLLTLFRTCEQYKVDGVLGPVKRHFDETPPAWLLKSSFYERRVNPTGMAVDWLEARTGNVLLRRSVIAPGEEPFRPEYRAGEDQDFFRRKIEEGRLFIWSGEAVAYEVVPPTRWSRSYMMRKGLLRGATAALQPSCGPMSLAKSVLAVILYVPALPFTLLLGQHVFMTLLVKLCDHLGKLLAVVGLNPVHEPYVAG